MIEIELFDGTILEFPAGTSDEVIDRVAKQETAMRRTAAAPPAQPQTDAATGAPMAMRPPSLDAPVAPDAPPAEPDLTDVIMGYGEEGLRRGGYLAQELARGVTNILGAPVDLINVSPMLLNLLPGEQGMEPFSDNPVGGSRMLWDALTVPRDAAAEAMGDRTGDAQPQDAFDRIAGRVANEVGAAAVPVGGMMAAGARQGTQGARAMQGSASRGTRIAGRAIEPYAVNPARAAGKDMAYAVAAGTGAGAAREIAPEGDEELYDVIGALGGVGAAAVGQGMTNTAINAGRALTGTGDDIVKEAAAARLGQAAGVPTTPTGSLDTSGLAQGIATGRRIGEVVPGFRETTADITQNPGLAGLEYSRAAGPNSGDFTRRRQDNAVAANEAITDMAPDATPGEFSGALRDQREQQFRAVDQSAQANVAAAEAEFEAAIRALEEAEAAAVSGATDAATTAARAAEDARGRLRPTMPAEARGAEVRTALESALKAAREVETEAWSQVRGEVDPAPLADAFDEVTNSLTQSERRIVADMGGAVATPGQLAPDAEEAENAALIAQVFGDAVEGGGPVDLAEITSLRSEFTSAARIAAGAGDVNKERIIGKYVAAIDAYLDQFDDIREAADAARAVSRDLNDRFTRRGDPVADTLATRPSGGPVVPDSAVPGRFVQPDEGQVSATERLLAETGDAPPVRTAIADQMRAETQGMTPEQITRYTAERQRMMQLFPDLEADLSTAARTGTAAREAERAATDTTREAARTRNRGTREAERALADRQRSETARVEETRTALYEGRGNDPRAIVGRYLEFGDERADDAMARIVNDANPTQAVTDLLNFVGDNPRAIEGAKAAFWRLMERTARSSGVSTRTPGGAQSWKFESLNNFLTDPQTRAVAERLYANDPEHLQNLMTMAETLRGANFAQTGRAAGSSGTPQGLLGSEILPSTETVGSRAFAFSRGQVGMTFLATNMGSIILRRAMLKGRKEQFDALIDAALLNPEIAAGLVKDYNPADLAALRRAAVAHLGVRSAQLDDLLMDEEGEDDEMMQAIGGP